MTTSKESKATEPTRDEIVRSLFSQQNWIEKNKAQSNRMTPREVYEYALYSDALFTGQILLSHWPYAFLNTVPIGASTINTAIVLRVEMHLDDFDLLDLSKTDETVYFGGQLEDEIVALASLCLGVRLASGGISRMFRHGSDPYGQPVESDRRLKPTLRFQREGPVLPDIRGSHSLNGLNRLESILRIEPERYISLVRACRLYGDALWISESEPHLAWLLLVSALETGANDTYRSQLSTHDTFKQAYPKLDTRLQEVGGVKHAREVADAIGHTLQATKKFVDFVIRFRPEPPKLRPKGKSLKLEWTNSNFKRMLGKVYGYRSRALHEGTPFPAPMFMPPFQPDRNSPGSEVPFVGLGGASAGGTWVPKDLPINLHTFHYVTRNALLNWWDCELIGKKQSVR